MAGEMHNGTATLEDSWAAFPKTKHALIVSSNNCILGYLANCFEIHVQVNYARRLCVMAKYL